MIRLLPKRNKWTIIWVLWLMSASGVQAQFTPEARFENPVLKSSIQEDFTAISLQKKGVLFLAMRERWRQEKMSWEITCLDTTLTEVWKKEHKLDKLFDPIHAYYDKHQFMYFLLTRYERKQFKLVKLNTENGHVEEFNGKLPLSVKLTKVRVAGDYAFLTGTFQNDITALRYNLLSGTTKVVPSIYSKAYNRLDVYSREPINAGYFMMQNSKNCDLKIQTYSNIVGLQPGKEITLPNRYQMHAATLYPINATESLLLGTYSIKCQPYPQGIASVRIKNGKQSRPRLYKFVDFRNYLNIYSPKKIKRIRRQVLKKEARGKEYTLGSKMILNEVLEHENSDDLLLVAERYWYRNKAVPASVLQRGGVPTMKTTGEFQFNSASISAVNRNGVKQWDNTIKMKHGVISSRMEPKVRVGFKGDSVILAYMRQRRDGITPMLWSKLVHRNKTLKKETEDEVSNPDTSDYIYSSTNQHFVHWYGDVFLLWGEQIVMNRKETGMGIRKEVAFINKLRYNKSKLTKKERKKLEKKKKQKIKAKGNEPNKKDTDRKNKK